MTQSKIEIEEQAAEWVARLGGPPLHAMERVELDRWLGADAYHRIAFEEARRAWGLMDEVAAQPRRLLEQAPSDLSATAARQRVHWAPALALAASLLVAVMAVTLWFGDPRVALVADHRTGPGERRSVTLADGSTVELGPASAIALRFTSEERRVELLSGLAYFTAAPRSNVEGRPFVVQAAFGTARALGTQFSVDLQLKAVEVIVVEHDVAVAVAFADGSVSQATLSPGQAVSYAAQGFSGPRQANLEQALSWRRDKLFFDRVPLRQVVAELNRYRRGHIVIGNEVLGSRLVSGVFETRDPEAVLATITRELGISTASTPFVTVLYK